MLGKLIEWVAGKEPVATATGLAAVVSTALGVAAAFGVPVTPEQIAAIGALAAALAGWAGRRAVTPVHVPKVPPPEAGGVPLALVILIAVGVVMLAGLGLCGDALFEDEDERNDLGAPALIADHDGWDDGGYYGDDYDQDYSSRDRNRNRGRNRGAFSPGPFEDSPVDFRDNCISLDCGGRDRSDEGEAR